MYPRFANAINRQTDHIPFDLTGNIPPVEICLLAVPLRCISGINIAL